MLILLAVIMCLLSVSLGTNLENIRTNENWRDSIRFWVTAISLFVVLVIFAMFSRNYSY